MSRTRPAARLSPLAMAFYPLLYALSRPERRDRLSLARARTIQVHQRRKAERIAARELKKEARIFERLLIGCWTRLGEAWLSRQADIATEGRAVRKRKVKKVQFARIFATAERIFFQIEVNRNGVWGMSKNVLPHRTTIKDLTSDETLLELSFACLRKVEAFIDDPRKGAWVIVNHLEGVGGIPVHVPYAEVLEHYPVNRIDRGPLLCGVGENRRVQIVDLASHPHVLVAGSSGGGKSNLINVMICTLMRYASPQILKFVLIDLKRMEFALFKDCPHLYQPLVDEPEAALKTLSELVDEVRRRSKLLSGKAKELSLWNTKYPNQAMPRIIVVIDEFAELMLASGPKVAADTETYITRLTNLGRAVGIHCIIATQRPAVRVIPNSIKINMPLIVSARVPSSAQSMVILGNMQACKLPHIPGRMVFLSGSTMEEIQAPYIPDEAVSASLDIARVLALGLIAPVGIEYEISLEGMAGCAVAMWGGDIIPSTVYEAVKPAGLTKNQVFGAIVKLSHQETIDVRFRIESADRHVELHIKRYRIEPDKKHKIIHLEFERDLEFTSIAPAVLALPANVPEPDAPPEPEKVWEEARTDRDLVLEFWRIYMVFDPDAYVFVRDAYEVYCKHCAQEGFRPASKNQFSKMSIAEIGPELAEKRPQRTNGRRPTLLAAYMGYRLEAPSIRPSVRPPEPEVEGEPEYAN